METHTLRRKWKCKFWNLTLLKEEISFIFLSLNKFEQRLKYTKTDIIIAFACWSDYQGKEMPQKVLIIYFDKKGVNKLCVLILEKFIFKRIKLFNMLYKSNINDLTKTSMSYFHIFYWLCQILKIKILNSSHNKLKFPLFIQSISSQYLTTHFNSNLFSHA